MADGPLIRPEDLPPEGGRPVAEEFADLRPGQTLAAAREEFERRVVLRALQEHHGNVSRTAERLGLDRTTLHRKLRALGIEAEKE